MKDEKIKWEEWNVTTGDVNNITRFSIEHGWKDSSNSIQNAFDVHINLQKDKRMIYRKESFTIRSQSSSRTFFMKVSGMIPALLIRMSTAPSTFSACATSSLTFSSLNHRITIEFRYLFSFYNISYDIDCLSSSIFNLFLHFFQFFFVSCAKCN